MKPRSNRLLPGVLAGTILAGIAFTATVANAQKNAGPKIPLGLGPILWPADNPYSKEKAELGWLLYYDTRLSSDGSVSCASCHAPDKGFTDQQPFSKGIKGQLGGRSAPTVINRAYSFEQFWDGRAKTLEEQAKGPIANPVEMMSEPSSDAAHKAAVARLAKSAEYRDRFKKAFGTDDFDIDHVAKAIATYERTLLSGNSAFDKYKAGNKKAMTEEAVRGMDVFFNKAACDSCHLGFTFTDGSYVNIGIGMDKVSPDLGRYMVSKREEDKGAFKTPTLRDIVDTAPYMHDGSLKTLEEVVEHYNKGGIKNPWLDQRLKPLNLTAQDKSDLVAFLRSLSGEGWRDQKPPKNFPK